MKLVLERNIFLNALAHIQSVVERRNTIPILANALLKAENGKLHLTATDMDLTIAESVEAQVEQPGQCTAPAHMIYEIVRKLPEGVSISLQLKSNQLLLTSERSKFTFGTLPVDDFPSIDAKPLPHKFALPANDLRNLIDRTRFAISTEETRYYLNGIYFHAAQNNDVPVLRSVATDGHRLARVEMPLPEGAGSIPGVIIPRKAVNEVRKLLEGADVSVEISLSETQIRFQLNNILLTSKLIDGTFPDYERVIPRENDKIMEIDRRILAQAVDRVATVAAEKTRAIKLSLNPGTLVLSASSADQGTATEELEVNYRADPIEIGFNSRYLLDIAQQMDGDGACFEMSGADAPTIVRDLTDTSALYVLMPMRV